MKQYLDHQQTAKLIELGFEKPKNTQYIQRAKARNLHSPFIEFGEPEFEGSYYIGELIGMLPNVTEDEDCEYATLQMYFDLFNWVVEYTGVDRTLYITSSIELIDALFEIAVKLKEEGVI